MPDDDDSDISPQIIESLLAQPTVEQQSAFLRSANLLDAGGLLKLLDEAAYLAGSDPGKARRLADLGAEAAQIIHAPNVIPRATYIRAQTHAINAEYDAALDLIAAAREGYKALGQELDALRTNLGLIHVLQELGRYQEALDAGKVILDNLEAASQPEAAKASPERGLVAATAYQNTGRCYEQMGRYDEALAAYAAAEAIFLALDMSDRIGDISNNRGIVLLSLGRGREALAAFEAAASIFAEADLALFHAQTQINIGDAHLLLGNYTRGLEAFERARRLLAPLEALADKHVLLLDMADAYLALNLYAEALAAYREADGLLQAAGMTHDRARALWGMGSALIAQSQFEVAGQILAQAESLFSAADNTPLLSSVLLEQASLLAARGDRGAALTTARRALTLVSGDDWPVQQVYAHIRIADLLLPNTGNAQAHLREARKLSDRLALPHLRARLNQRLGHLHLLLNQDQEAQKVLQTAVDEIEQLRGILSQEMARTSFVRDKTAAYEDLVQLHLARGGEENTWQAFAVAERAKSRALVDLLTGVVDARAAIPTDPELAAQLQLKQAGLESVYNELLSGQGKAALSELYGRAVKLEQEISRLRLQVTAAAPAPAGQFDGPLTPEALQQQLPSDAILVTYYICGDEVLAFVGIRGKLKVARRLGLASSAQKLAQKLAMQWERFRAGPGFVARHMPQLEQSTQRVLAALYDELIAPLETIWAGSTGETASPPKLVVVPHGILHQVPFHALFDGKQYLIDRFEISYAPSLTVWALCQKRTAPPARKALVFGVADSLIPAAAAEAKAVAQHLDGVTVRTRETEATLAALQAEASGCSVLHLACHGLFRADNPMFSSLRLHDGWLMAVDAMQFELSGALVTLSACESGRSQVMAGDEIIGLTRAFLGAGASTLVVSLWLVQDETTMTLMGNWYEQLKRGTGRAAALRAAQLSLKAVHPHPYYWAPFVLVGQR
ncbi:MAG: CHAT domain-containing protein [Chloroflexi bacterium]|nr:CHAT domain-containing protein [Chloroflexota bacterium]